jgi:hypothetical protein
MIFGLIWAFTRKPDSDHATPPPVATQSPNFSSSPAATVTAPGVIRPENAENYFDKQVTVEMKVVKTGRANTTARFFLNSKVDLSAMDNLTITFTAEVFDQLRARGMTDLDSYFLSKTIRVTGTVSRYGGRYQIQVHDANQIAFVSPRW